MDKKPNEIHEKFNPTRISKHTYPTLQLVSILISFLVEFSIMDTRLHMKSLEYIIKNHVATHRILF